MILIDTHVWIWLHSSPENLSPAAIEALEKEPQIAISVVSIFETMVAIEKGRIACQVEPETLVRRWLNAWELTRIPVSEEIVFQSRIQAFSHADPFDRLIAGTAFHENLQLMTADRNLIKLDWLRSIPA